MRTLAPLLGLALSAACVVPQARNDVVRSAPAEPGAAPCCLEHDRREVEPWGRESLGAERVNRSLPRTHAHALVVERSPEPPVQPARSEPADLVLELELTRRALQLAQDALEEKTRAADELREDLVTLRAELDGSRSECQALAERLRQAQIRRLEAEKLLLEWRIEAERARPDSAGPIERSGLLKPVTVPPGRHRPPGDP